MAYGEKYRFCAESQNGSEIKVLILQDGYTGQVYDRPMGRSPLLRRENNGKILGSSFELYAECLVDAEYAELYTSSAREFKVEVYKDETVIWFGFITPELYSEPDIAPPYDVQIVATDGLGELKNYEFLSSGPESLYSHLVNLLQYTGLYLEFLIASTLQYIDGDGAESGQNSLLNFQIDLSHLNGENCYDVLQLLLDSLNARIMMYDGQWLVYRETDLVHLASGTGLNVYDANGLYKTLDIASFGSMTSCQWWPVGQLSSVVVPANNMLSIEAPNHYKSNILDDSAWTVENSASYDSAEGAYILPDEGSNIAQKIEFGRELGSRLRLSILARNVGSGEEDQPIGIEVLIDGRSYAGARQYWLVKTASSGRGGGAYAWNTVEGQIEGELAVPSDSDTSDDAQEIEIILPLYANSSTSYFYASSVQVRLFNPAGTHDIYVYDCRLSLYNQKQGWKTDALIDNQAREDAGTIEVTMVDSSTALSTAEIIMTGVPLDPQGRIIQNWKIGADPEGSYLTVLTEDYAMAVALPRMKYTGTLNVPAGHIPSLFLRDGRFYSLTSYSYDMLNDEVEVELLSIPVADVEVSQEILPMISASGTASSGSSGGGGGESGGGSSFNDWFYFDQETGSVGTKYNLFSEREVSAKGLYLGTSAASITLHGVSDLGKTISDGDTSTFSANAINSIYNRLVELEENGGSGSVDLTNYYTKNETNNAITSALSPYFKSASFTKSNIKSTLGISDWALASSKPSYTTSDVTEGSRLYFTNARAVSAVLGSSAIGSITAYPYWTGTAWATKTLPTDLSDFNDDILDGYYLPLEGGTITGNLRLKGSGNYGNYLYFGDSSYCYINEDSDDHLKLYGAKGINLVTGSGYSVTINGSALLTEDNINLDGYATEDWVTEQGYATQSWVTGKGYATESFVTGKGYATESFVTGKGYATQTWVKDQGYITSDDLGDYLSSSGGTISGNLAVTGTFKVTGASTFTGKTTHNGGIATTTLTASGNVTPTTDKACNLGSSSYYWKYLYAQDGRFSSTLTVASTSTFTGKTTHNGGIATTTLTASSNVTPTTDKSCNLGSTLYYWNYMYAQYGRFSSTVTAGGLITANGGLTVPSGQTLKVGTASLTWDTSGLALKCDQPFYSAKEISAKGLYLGSDMRFKNKIEDVALDLDIMADAPIFRFTWIDGDKKEHIGSSAQYWKSTDARELVTVDNNDFHRLDYATLGVMMGKSLAMEVRELKREVQRLKSMRYE